MGRGRAVPGPHLASKNLHFLSPGTGGNTWGGTCHPEQVGAQPEAAGSFLGCRLWSEVCGEGGAGIRLA